MVLGRALKVLPVICRVLLLVVWWDLVVDGLSLGSVLDIERDGLMVWVVPCKPGTRLTVGLGSGKRLTSKNPVSGLWTLVTRPR